MSYYPVRRWRRRRWPLRRRFGLFGLGQAQPTQAASSGPSNTVATVVMVGGLVAGVVVLIVGSRMGQNRLWTRHILKRNRRGRR